MYPDGCADLLEDDPQWDLRPENKWKKRKKKSEKSTSRNRRRKRLGYDYDNKQSSKPTRFMYLQSSYIYNR
jgi:hypothetical protein